MKYRVVVLLLILSLPAYAFDLEIINTEPAPVEAGEYADITIRMSRDVPVSTPYSEVRLELRDSDEMRLIGESTVNIGELSARSSITKTFRMYFSEDVPEGTVTVPFLIRSNQAAREVNVDLFVQEAADLPALEIGQIETVPDTLLPDTDRNELTVTLQNLGEREAELVRAELAPESEDVEASDAFSLEDSVSSIPAGEERDLEFTVDLEEEAREPVPADLTLRYRTRRSASESFQRFEDVLRTRIPVDDAPFLTVEQNVTAIPRGSADNKVRFTVVNNGTEEAEEVRVRLFPDISYPFIFDATTLYVSSELDPGERVTAEADVSVTTDAAVRDYSISTELESLVGEALYTRDDTLTVRVKPGSGISTRVIGFGIIAVVLLVGIGLGVYNRYVRNTESS